MFKLSPYHKIFHNEWKLDPLSPKYNMVFDQTVSSALDCLKLKSALHRFILDNFIFNCHVTYQDGEPCFVENTEIVNLEFYPNECSEDEIYQFVIKPFNLEESVLYRFGVFHYQDFYRIVLVFHHLLMDGNNMLPFINEISNYYNNSGYTSRFSILEQKKIIELHSSQLSDNISVNNNHDHWQHVLSSSEPINLQFLNITEQSGLSHNSIKSINFNLSSNDNTNLRHICDQYGITPYWFSQLTFAVLLNYYTSENKFVISYPFLIKNGEELICGSRVNTGFMQYDFENTSLTLIDVINSVLSFKQQNSCINVPIYQTIKADKKSYLNVCFAKTNLRNDPFQFNNVSVISINHTNDINYLQNLTVEMESSNQNTQFNVKYDINKFDERTLLIFVNHYRNLLSNVIADFMNGYTDKPINQYKILSDKEYNQIVNNFNQASAGYPKDKTINQLFEEQVERTPNNIALVFEDSRLTYRELNDKANQLANYLLTEYQIKFEDKIALLLKRNQDVVIAILAVLKTGAAYVPICPTIPNARLDSILEDCEPILLITHNVSNNYKSQLTLSPELISNIFEKRSTCNPLRALRSNNLAYIIYTSGTTGKPKGVMIEHKNVVNTIFGLSNLYQHNNALKLTGFSNYIFDASVLELWVSLLFGNELHLLNDELRKDIIKLKTYICNECIDFIPYLPTKLFELLPFIEYKSLSGLYCGGEAYNFDIMNLWHSKYNIYNVYGTTETGIFATHHKISPNNINRQIIGKPLPNFQTYVLNHNQQILPFNIVGQLYIAGDGVGRGYLKNPALTKKKFIINNFYNETFDNKIMYATGDLVRRLPTGDLEYVGRIDTQVKIRGYRIELNEITVLLLSYTNINDAVVVVKYLNQNRSNPKIIAYYVADSMLNADDIKIYLAQYLPDYMLPDSFVYVNKIPLKNASGKVDEAALPEPCFETPNEMIVSVSEQEVIICQGYADALNLQLQEISIKHDFFDLGGDSLSAISLTIILQKYFNITTNDVFKFRTPEQIAKNVSYNGGVLQPKFEYIKNFYTKGHKHNKGLETVEYKEYLDKIKHIRLDFSTNLIHTVLLTGGTGYLGCNLLYQLLTTTDYMLYLLVRDQDSTGAYNRVKSKYQNYFNDNLDNYRSRVKIFSSNIIYNKLGVSNDDYQHLVDNVDSIIHAAALVKHYGDYDIFYQNNVQATINLLELCKQTKNKDFHYISTYSVISGGYVPNHPHYIFHEDSDHSVICMLDNYYNRTKYLGEEEVIKYRNYGIKSSIYRVGNLAVMSCNGKLQDNIEDNSFFSRLKTLLKLGVVSEHFNQVEISPVDITALGIVKLFDKKETSDMVHHVFNPHNIALTNVTDCGGKILLRNISINQFVDKIEDELKSGKYIDDIKRFMLHYGWLDAEIFVKYTDIHVSSERTQMFLHALGVNWESCNDNLITNYIKIILRTIKNDEYSR